MSIRDISADVLPGRYIARDCVLLATGAAVLVPAAWPIVGKMYIHQYDTESLAARARTWWQAADEIAESHQRIERRWRGVTPEQWGGSDDREAFDRHIEKYIHGLKVLSGSARAVAMVLWATATLLFAFILYMTVIAVRLLLLAWRVLNAMELSWMTGGSLGWAAAQAAVTPMAGEMFADFVVWEKRLADTLHALAGVLGLATASDASNNEGGWGYLAQATFAQAPMLVWGSATRLSRDATARGIGGVKPGPRTADPRSWFPDEPAPRVGHDRSTPLGPDMSWAYRYYQRGSGAANLASGTQQETEWAKPAQDESGDYDFHVEPPWKRWTG